MSEPRTIFGVHSVLAYDLATRKPIARGRVVGEASFNAAGEVIPLNGGSSLFPWGNESGAIESEVAVTLREFPTGFYDVLFGTAATVRTAEASGSVDGFANVSGESVLDATTGIATVAAIAGKENNLKTTDILVEAVSPTTVDLYALTDVDFHQGEDVKVVNEKQKINTSPLTITGTAGETDINEIGIRLTGGSGTVAMTTGDTAIFSSRAINSGSDETVIGKAGAVPRTVGLVLSAQKKGSGEVFTIDVFKATGSGFPHPLTEKEWAESEITFQSTYDDDRGGVASIRRTSVTPKDPAAV